MKHAPIGKAFPNQHTNIAYYDPATFIVAFNDIESKDFAPLFDGNLDKDKAARLGIAVHEMRHHLDHVSTLWGQRNILKLYKAINARLSNDPTVFHDIMPFKREEQQFHYDTYYKIIQHDVKYHSPADRWKWQLTTGLKFDMQGKLDANNPIFFIQFATAANVNVARVPLSIAALLETSAIKEQLEVEYNWINMLPEDEKIVELALKQTSVFADIIYNPHCAVYNSIVHLSANMLGLSNVPDALAISSAIATIALNLPLHLIGQIPLREDVSDEWFDRSLRMMENNDYGYIFYSLLYNYIPEYAATKVFNIEGLLRSNNLPLLKQVLIEINNEFSTIRQTTQQGKHFREQFSSVLQEGHRIFELRGIAGDGANALTLFGTHEYKPGFLFGDTDFELTEYSLNKAPVKPMDNLGFNDWYSFATIMGSAMDEFFNIRAL